MQPDLHQTEEALNALDELIKTRGWLIYVKFLEGAQSQMLEDALAADNESAARFLGELAGLRRAARWVPNQVAAFRKQVEEMKAREHMRQLAVNEQEFKRR